MLMPIDSGGTYVHAGLSLRLSRVSGNYASCQPDASVTESRGLSVRSEWECNIANNNSFYVLNFFLRTGADIVRVIYYARPNKFSPIDIDNKRLERVAPKRAIHTKITCKTRILFDVCTN